MPKKPEILSTTVVAESRLFCIEQLHLRFSNGTGVEYERLKGRSRGAVLVVPMLDDETVLLIREYSAGLDRYELALPKGKIDGDESFEEAANRELKEEIGYGAKDIRHLSAFSVAPGYLGHVTQIMLAQDLYEERLEGDEPEPLEIVPWSIHKLNELITRDDCTEARSIAALFMARELLVKDLLSEDYSVKRKQ
jgi:ADP-ribose diphosphatase